MGAPAFERPPLYFELAGYFGGEQAVRFGDWKAVATRTRSGHPTFTLHDLARDPAEQVDLTAQRPVEAAQALELLQAQHAPHPSFPLFPGETSEDRGSR
jgi:arylsulfatase